MEMFIYMIIYTFIRFYRTHYKHLYEHLFTNTFLCEEHLAERCWRRLAARAPTLARLCRKKDVRKDVGKGVRNEL